MQHHPALSIVVPLYNEAENVALLHASVLEGLAQGEIFEYELILVDDGSRDGTFREAERLVGLDARVRVVGLRRNYGQTAAIAAGIGCARGSIIVTMDGDLQNDPADIPRLLKRLDDGYDIVAGWRRQRKDGRSRVLVSQAANALIACVTGVRLRDSGCSLKVFRADLLRNLPLYGDMHRFIPALSLVAGARVAQVEVKHHPRTFGASKYGFSRIWKVMLDIVSLRFLLGHVRRPLRGHIGAALLCCAAGAALLAHALFTPGTAILTSGFLAILAISLGVFVGACGILGTLYVFRDQQPTCYAVLAARVQAQGVVEPEAAG